MEYMEYGDLNLYLEKPLPENEARYITLQVAEGLKLLHENGFAHRDLKPAVKSSYSRTDKIVANMSRISLSSTKALIGGSKLVILVSANVSMRKMPFFDLLLELQFLMLQRCTCLTPLA
jgi:calcium/calmodulin-dependent protein kinase I